MAKKGFPYHLVIPVAITMFLLIYFYPYFEGGYPFGLGLKEVGGKPSADVIITQSPILWLVLPIIIGVLFYYALKPKGLFEMLQEKKKEDIELTDMANVDDVWQEFEHDTGIRSRYGGNLDLLSNVSFPQFATHVYITKLDNKTYYIIANGRKKVRDRNFMVINQGDLKTMGFDTLKSFLIRMYPPKGQSMFDIMMEYAKEISPEEAEVMKVLGGSVGGKTK